MTNNDINKKNQQNSEDKLEIEKFKLSNDDSLKDIVFLFCLKMEKNE